MLAIARNEVTGINTFAQQGFVSEIDDALRELANTVNELIRVLSGSGMAKARELARISKQYMSSMINEPSPMVKCMILCALLKKLFTMIKGSGPKEVIQVRTRVMARADHIVSHIKLLVEKDTRKKEISVNSKEVRSLINGSEGSIVSRKEAIKAMKRATSMLPGLKCSHRPNDGRMTMRLTARLDDLES